MCLKPIDMFRRHDQLTAFIHRCLSVVALLVTGVGVSMSRLFDGLAIRLFDGIPATGSRVL
jgi:hypothetical protein